MSLRRANVAGLGLSNVSAADCRFAGAHNLDKLRLESDVSFAESRPRRLGRACGAGAGGQVIAEERAWRAAPASSASSPLGCSEVAGLARDDRPGVLDPAQIAGLYRALRKGREDTKDEPGAADFYYGEMEMRRLARRSGTTPGGTRAGAIARGRVERWHPDRLLAGVRLRPARLAGRGLARRGHRTVGGRISPDRASPSRRARSRTGRACCMRSALPCPSPTTRSR